MRGLDPRIHPLRKKDRFAKRMDCRVKPGNDGPNLARASYSVHERVCFMCSSLVGMITQSW